MSSDEYRKNMSIATSGEKNGFWKKKHTKESKLKISLKIKNETS